MKGERVRRSGAMAAIASFALVALVACGGVSPEEALEVTRVPVMSDAAAQATKAAESGATPGAAGETAAAAVTVEIESHDIAFEPTDVTVPANTDVKIVLPNLGAAAHNFSIDALDVSVDIAPGDTKEVVINAPAGEYEFVCNVPGHKEAGMVGTLIVSEDAAAAPAGEATPAEAAPAATPADAAAPAEEATPAEGAATAESAAGAAEESTPVAEAEAAPPAGAAPVEVVSHDIFFEPKEITIPADTDVTFVLPNEGVTLHNFAIDALDIDVDLAPGETQEVVINAPAGEYEIYCNVPGHKAAGMVSRLIVTEGAAVPADAAPAEEATPAEETASGEAATAEAAEAPPAAPAPATPPAVPAPEGSASSGPIDLIADDIFFSTEQITIPADTDVTFNLTNAGVAAHTFTIDALDVAVPLPPGESAAVVVNAPAGEYEYYCTEPGHKDIGMSGTLTVTADGTATTVPAAAAREASPAAEAAAAATPAAAEEAAASAPAAADSVEVVSHDIFFEPKELSIPADTDVTIQLPNEGVTLHNISIDALDVDVDIAPGETQEVVINAPAGEYEFYCNVPGHKAAGMLGTLTVG